MPLTASLRLSAAFFSTPQDKVAAAEDSLTAARKEAGEQVEAARKGREKALEDLDKVQKQLNDMNERLLQMASGGPAQAHPVTGEAWLLPCLQA
jgi:uncharacterized protein (DUF3084 family)